MNTPIDGGPAFPVLSDNVSFPTWFGMTLRDYFAAKAMQSLVAAFPKGNDEDGVCFSAYAIADAMIKARSEA